MLPSQDLVGRQPCDLHSQPVIVSGPTETDSSRQCVFFGLWKVDTADLEELANNDIADLVQIRCVDEVVPQQVPPLDPGHLGQGIPDQVFGIPLGI